MTPLNSIDQELINKLGFKFGWPLHLVFKDRFRKNAQAFRQVADQYYPNLRINFAVKSNPCRGAIRLASQTGIGIDAVSEYELQTALEEQVSGDNIVCNGNAKSLEYLTLALENQCLIAVDNLTELELIADLSKASEKIARILLRVVDMPLSGLTSKDQSTAAEWTKFGFPYHQIPQVLTRLAQLTKIKFLGFSAHIGTQICSAKGYDLLLEYLFDLCDRATSVGARVEILDLGGGFPISYLTREQWHQFDQRLRAQLDGTLPVRDWVTWDSIPMGYEHLQGRSPQAADKWSGKQYWAPYPGSKMLARILIGAKEAKHTTSDRLQALGNPLLIIEPGRSLIGSAGVTVARVSSVKTVQENLVVMLDLGINNQGTNLITVDLFPCEIIPERDDDVPTEAFLAGRLCFSGDMISKAKVRLNRLPEPGELLVIHQTGAYCADHFASHSCGFPKPGKIAIRADDTFEVWRQPESFDNVFPPLLDSDPQNK